MQPGTKPENTDNDRMLCEVAVYVVYVSALFLQQAVARSFESPL